ncbi:Uncharacterized membrane protein YgdD, TMEM256/DUF423 family [Fontimonas thermophila]|uniref:Uncharacterized membrane protein YgdD, TMEM256/DUF423 family n=1 Tax=Fontimonas thermophila TaxID=1076937 RepID=A0A1I2K0E2_9GAMM|nr:DUF423 domain-containing protein [Fontimonas thermophila]SFF59879.1 Uncharacterized membrane protein YgdD, TMEM256/DUF423 family [Fontimonas thermophila]
MSALWPALGAVYGLLGVALGAFGAHALRGQLPEGLLSVWKTAVEYQMYHALALVLVGVLLRSAESGLLYAAAVCFAVGVLLFSGSLYVLCLSGVRAWGVVTPFGGVLLIAGWALLLAALLSSR